MWFSNYSSYGWKGVVTVIVSKISLFELWTSRSIADSNMYAGDMSLSTM